jgi:hypothetical protein
MTQRGIVPRVMAPSQAGIRTGAWRRLTFRS